MFLVSSFFIFKVTPVSFFFYSKRNERQLTYPYYFISWSVLISFFLSFFFNEEGGKEGGEQNRGTRKKK